MDKKIFEKTEWKLYRYFEKDKKIKAEALVLMRKYKLVMMVQAMLKEQ